MLSSPESELLQRLAREGDRPWPVGAILRAWAMECREFEQV